VSQRGVFALRVALVVAVALGACAGEDDAQQASSTTTPAAMARDGLCRALDAARGGESDRAKAIFDDDTHEALHDLGDALEDRAVKADLLEAKGRIENGDLSATAFEDMVRVVGDAAGSAGMPAPPLCDGMVSS
jgi:Tfp pilus assembly protein PilF